MEYTWIASILISINFCHSAAASRLTNVIDRSLLFGLPFSGSQTRPIWTIPAESDQLIQPSLPENTPTVRQHYSEYTTCDSDRPMPNGCPNELYFEEISEPINSQSLQPSQNIAATVTVPCQTPTSTSIASNSSTFNSLIGGKANSVNFSPRTPTPGSDTSSAGGVTAESQRSDAEALENIKLEHNLSDLTADINTNFRISYKAPSVLPSEQSVRVKEYYHGYKYQAPIASGRDLYEILHLRANFVAQSVRDHILNDQFKSKLVPMENSRNGDHVCYKDRSYRHLYGLDLPRDLIDENVSSFASMFTNFDSRSSDPMLKQCYHQYIIELSEQRTSLTRVTPSHRNRLWELYFIPDIHRIELMINDEINLDPCGDLAYLYSYFREVLRKLRIYLEELTAVVGAAEFAHNYNFRLFSKFNEVWTDRFGSIPVAQRKYERSDIYLWFCTLALRESRFYLSLNQDFADPRLFLFVAHLFEYIVNNLKVKPSNVKREVHTGTLHILRQCLGPRGHETLREASLPSLLHGIDSIVNNLTDPVMFQNDFRKGEDCYGSRATFFVGNNCRRNSPGKSRKYIQLYYFLDVQFQFLDNFRIVKQNVLTYSSLDIFRVNVMLFNLYASTPETGFIEYEPTMFKLFNELSPTEDMLSIIWDKPLEVPRDLIGPLSFFHAPTRCRGVNVIPRLTSRLTEMLCDFVELIDPTPSDKKNPSSVQSRASTTITQDDIRSMAIALPKNFQYPFIKVMVNQHIRNNNVKLLSFPFAAVHSWIRRLLYIHKDVDGLQVETIIYYDSLAEMASEAHQIIGLMDVSEYKSISELVHMTEYAMERIKSLCERSYTYMNRLLLENQTLFKKRQEYKEKIDSKLLVTEEKIKEYDAQLLRQWRYSTNDDNLTNSYVDQLSMYAAIESEFYQLRRFLALPKLAVDHHESQPQANSAI